MREGRGLTAEPRAGYEPRTRWRDAARSFGRATAHWTSRGARAPTPLVKTGSFYTATVVTFAPGEFFTIGRGRLVMMIGRLFDRLRRRACVPGSHGCG